jgi:hypothetical protein
MVRDVVELLLIERVMPNEVRLAEIFEDGDVRGDVGKLNAGDVVKGGVEGAKEVVPERGEDSKEEPALEERMRKRQKDEIIISVGLSDGRDVRKGEGEGMSSRPESSSSRPGSA